LNNVAGDIYRLIPSAASSSIRPSLDFSAPGESLFVAFVEIGTCLGCSGVPTWYPPYFRGRFNFYFNNGQKLTIRLYSDDLRRIPVEDRPCSNYACDSMNVRKILDRNGMPSVPVSQVTTMANGRIAGLQLHYVPGGAVTLPKPITILPQEIGNLSALITLTGSGNTIDSISPRIGRCENLTTLLADNCGITALPDSIVWCKQLQYVSLDGNRLTRLPDSMGTLKSIGMMSITRNRLISLPESMTKLDSMDCIFIAGNRICTLSSSVQTWLTNVRTQMHCQRLEPVWPDSQECTTGAGVQRDISGSLSLPIVKWNGVEKTVSVFSRSGINRITGVVLYNLAGRAVLQARASGESVIHLSAGHLARGVYSVALLSGTEVAGVHKILVNR
jgi:hypothetical protein